MTRDPPWVIRRLGQADLSQYTAMRLEALRQYPAAFAASFEEEQGSDLSGRIGDPPNVTLGGFVDGALAGMVAVVVSPRRKQCHKGHVVGVYVAPPWRRSGLARALIDRLIEQARSDGLLVLTLGVTVGNVTARRLYLNAGFEVYGVEPLSLRLGTELLDEELMALRLT